MPLYRTQVILPMFTNLPEDVIVNQFHFFATPTDTATVAVQIYNQLKNFYTLAYGATAGGRVSYIDWQNVVCKTFNLSDPTPRIPVISPNFGFAPGTLGSTIPTEVAAVLTFQAAPESGIRYQRLYNRIYLGAISPAHMVASATDDFPRFAGTFITNVTNAAKGLVADGNLSGALWRQVSNATGAAISRPVVGGWMDNSPDTQRRRSVLATTRNTWTPA